MGSVNYFHVDVFATRPLTGNGLVVFLDTATWSAPSLQRVAQEMRQFESIFLSEVSATGATARVFTVEEELPFAGHPLLGAAAVLHRTHAPGLAACSWTLRLPHGPVVVTTRQRDGHYLCEMNQGRPLVGPSVGISQLHPILDRLGLSETDLSYGLQVQVISTGLPYLILPLTANALSRARIHGSDFEALLGAVGAKFVLVLDTGAREARTWDNLGQVEDVATGSAAGPAAAYLLQHQLADARLPIEISQGRFVGRPSQLVVAQDEAGNLWVRGEVWPVAHGTLDFEPT
jgi:trans-2,3-dihydro-3-hydroxyanthranilate isomerase